MTEHDEDEDEDEDEVELIFLLLCRSCFMITKYSFLDFVTAKNIET
jgi:hypothetical protein